jgi:hypothetical protein
MTAATICPCRSSAIEVAKIGMPCRKLVVPSSGSMMPAMLAVLPSTSPLSSITRPKVGRALVSSARTISSARAIGRRDEIAGSLAGDLEVFNFAEIARRGFVRPSSRPEP